MNMVYMKEMQPKYQFSNVQFPAGLTFQSGKDDDFYLCYIVIDSDQHQLRFFNKESIKGPLHDLAMVEICRKHKVNHLIVDFPLSHTLCHTCTLVCPGSDHCPKKEVVYIRREIEKLILHDAEEYQANPKKYEQQRNKDDLVTYAISPLEKRHQSPLLSKAFKRRLKKGFLPYWNRPLDFWLWVHYYDAWLKVFKTTFDSFGHVSFMHQHQLFYWKKHLNAATVLWESSPSLLLLELHRAEIISKRSLLSLSDLNQAPLARLEIIRDIKRKFFISIQERDEDDLVRIPRAFQSFLLALAGQRLKDGLVFQLPQYTLPEETHFVVPHFLNQ